MIKNEPKNMWVTIMWMQCGMPYENRGRWYYFLVKEDLSRDFPWVCQGCHA